MAYQISLGVTDAGAASHKGPAATLYQELEPVREPYLRRARDAAKLTIPRLLTDTGQARGVDLRDPFQSVGARGVNNLAAKLLLTLFPPNSSFFRLTVDELALNQIAGADAAGGTEIKTEIDGALGTIEKAVVSSMEADGIRVPLAESLKHLVATGNALFYLPDSGGARMFQLPNYVVDRDSEGHVIDIVVKETLSFAMLPASVKAQVESLYPTADPMARPRELDLYTWVHRTGRERFEVRQEICGITVPESEGSFPADKTPWIALRFSAISGEPYGRGHVEEYIGDLRTCEGLSQAIVEGSAAMARLVGVVNPAGFTKVKALNEAPNGGFVAGNVSQAGVPVDVGFLQVNKAMDFRVAAETLEKVVRSLEAGFLLHSSVQRNAERVTAEEIRFMAQELESTLGANYTVLGAELQLPLVKRVLDRLRKQNPGMPELPKGVKPTIVTGLEALGRGNDARRLEAFTQGASALLGPEAVAQYINPSEWLARYAAATGNEASGLILTPEELQARQQAAMAQQMATDVAPEIVKQGGGMMAQAMAAQQQPQK